MKCSWTRGWASSHRWTAGALYTDRLSQITWTARPGSTWRSISSRKSRKSTARRLCDQWGLVLLSCRTRDTAGPAGRARPLLSSSPPTTGAAPAPARPDRHRGRSRRRGHSSARPAAARGGPDTPGPPPGPRGSDRNACPVAGHLDQAGGRVHSRRRTTRRPREGRARRTKLSSQSPTRYPMSRSTWWISTSRKPPRRRREPGRVRLCRECRARWPARPPPAGSRPRPPAPRPTPRRRRGSLGRAARPAPASMSFVRGRRRCGTAASSGIPSGSPGCAAPAGSARGGCRRVPRVQPGSSDGSRACGVGDRGRARQQPPG